MKTFTLLLVLFLLGVSRGQLAEDILDDGDTANVLSAEEAEKEADLLQYLESIFMDTSDTTTAMPVETYAIKVEKSLTEQTSCLTANRDVGQCIPLEYCYMEASMDRRDNCSSMLEICCPDDYISLTVIPQKIKCGMQNPPASDMKMVLNKDQAYFGEFPWTVIVLASSPKNDFDPNGPKKLSYVCGGSLIHPSVVLTTYHHITDINKTWVVRAGEWDVSTRSPLEIYPNQEREVQRVIPHEQYNHKRLNLQYDIALLILKSPVDLMPNVGTVCLPPPGQVAAEGTRCLSSGWGKKNFKQYENQIIMKKIELPVVGRNTCQNILRTTRLGPVFRLHDTFMCAGGESGKDTCTGDGGSPLVCPIPSLSNRYMQHGMVAWGINCGGRYPAVYVNVAFLRPWIDEKMKDAGFETDSYTF